ncbi:MAG: hypothetical protein QOI66_1576, partial [Myxococcales bacterium]|nr:hypothetical protein [Myxococcales bacterium]
VVSINGGDEIEKLTPQFPSVSFRVATRDAQTAAGRPLVSLDDVLAALRDQNRALSGIVNSDIVLGPLGGEPLAGALSRMAGEGLAFNKRMDQQTESDPGVRYDLGIDAFFFGRKLLFGYPATSFFLGLPWWDYFFAAFPLVAGYPVVEINEPIAFHLVHPSLYDVSAHWIPLGAEALRLLGPLFSNKQELLAASGMDAAVAAIGWLIDAMGSNDVAALEDVFNQFAEATIQLLKEGTRGPDGPPDPASAVVREV